MKTGIVNDILIENNLYNLLIKYLSKYSQCDEKDKKRIKLLIKNSACECIDVKSFKIHFGLVDASHEEIFQFFLNNYDLVMEYGNRMYGTIPDYAEPLDNYEGNLERPKIFKKELKSYIKEIYY